MKASFIAVIFTMATMAAAGNWYCSETDPCTDTAMVCDGGICWQILPEGGHCGGAAPPPRRCGPGLVCKAPADSPYGKCVKAGSA
ncbi:hypothetical protein Dda_4870 [Drechslerella dactyloides]|uniref:Uncharacterized protein n=1 Tax=Drechslerella dactyloides TaxID=74499 RepID=A0AAD6IXP9_DREDA|nr:hypothetical protein Dda_4870 [Drechslerella dactyloides]